MRVTEHDRVLMRGRTCWRIERADRFALIVDAAEYFRVAKAAMLKTEHSILLIGWDFDTRIRLEPGRQSLPGPNRLGKFLSWLPKQRPGLHIYVLKWDLGLIEALGRGMMPLFILNMMTDKRVRLELDHTHPVGAAHHQKIMVIDDCLAFCGGIDMTADRWDERQHLDRDKRRTKPTGGRYGPWHDATAALDGGAARALGDLARERWRFANGERLQPVAAPADAWPDGLVPTFEQVDVGIARTLPELPERPEVREIESLYLAAFARARHSIYIETQYLASRTLVEALARRLGEADGPEIIIVLPEGADGWLEQEVMDGARRKLLSVLWRADRHKRLGVYYPVTGSGTAIYVHAKILVVDDWLLRVGSSNLNNRSMGFDTECGLALEVVSDTPGERGLRDAILSIRRDLVREHLAVAPQDLESAVEDCSGSLLNAVESLRREGRSLVPFDPADIADDQSVLAENELLDPERTQPGLGERLVQGISNFMGRAGLHGR